MPGTTYFYDAAGRVTRTVPEPLWTPEDRALMLALSEHEASLCPGCGQPRDRAWHPEMEGWWHVATATCQACTAKGAANTRYVIAREDPTAAAENPTEPLHLVFRDPEDGSTGPDSTTPREEAGLDE